MVKRYFYFLLKDQNSNYYELLEKKILSLEDELKDSKSQNLILNNIINKNKN
jgi:hypothetical protein